MAASRNARKKKRAIGCDESWKICRELSTSSLRAEDCTGAGRLILLEVELSVRVCLYTLCCKMVSNVWPTGSASCYGYTHVKPREDGAGRGSNSSIQLADVLFQLPSRFCRFKILEIRQAQVKDRH